MGENKADGIGAGEGRASSVALARFGALARQAARALRSGGRRVRISVNRAQSRLERAMLSGDARNARKMLALGADPCHSIKGRRSPLEIAAVEGLSGLLSEMLALGADPDSWSAETMSRGSCPLLLKACLDGPLGGRRVAVARLLLEAGADPNLAAPGGRTALHAAAEYCLEDGRLVLELLARGADPNARDRWGRSPLHFAIEAWDLDAMRALVDAGCDIELANNSGVTPLMMACLGQKLHAPEGMDPAVELLLARGADVMRRDHNRATCVDYADVRGRMDLLRHLEALRLSLGERDALEASVGPGQGQGGSLRSKGRRM